MLPTIHVPPAAQVKATVVVVVVVAVVVVGTTVVAVDALATRHTSLPNPDFLQTSETPWETTLAPALLQTPPGLATVPDTTAKPELTKTTPANKQATTVERNKPLTGAYRPI